MKIVLSPAKSLDFKTELPYRKFSEPLFPEKALLIAKQLSKYSEKELGSLMKLSPKLAQLNYRRYQEFSPEFTPENARPAVYAFSGDVYTGLDVYTLEDSKIETAQKTLRILSGLYGVLRPLDLIQPYRLEMGTKLPVEDKKDLYQFWKNTITQTLNDELKPNELFLNLASVEYFKAIDSKQLKTTVISPVFKDFKNGKLKIISFFAKKARGSMARFCIDTNAKTLDDIKNFNYNGYGFSQAHTEKETQPVFVR